TVGEGSEFCVALPRAEAQSPKVATTATGPAAGPTAKLRGRILVVDDEPALGKAIARTLSDEHEVVVAHSAKQALERRAGDGAFDVILADRMMPEMTGMELYAQLAATEPALAARMVFMSGGAFTPDAAQFLQDQSRPIVEKPFRAAALRDAVQNV